MDVIYIFHGKDKIIIPIIFYDYMLFRRLSSLGYLDKQNNRFILHCRQEAEQYKAIFSGRPYVEVKEGGFVSVNGFFGRIWPKMSAEGKKDNQLSSPQAREKATEVNLLAASSTSSVLIEKDRNCLASAKRPAEKFSLRWIERLKVELHSRKYSPKTIKSYVYFNRDLCRVLQKPAEQITSDDFKRYLSYLDSVKDLSSSTMNLATSAIRFFFNFVMKKRIDQGQYRPHQDKTLPSVLSRMEIEVLLDSENNPKHRLLLMLTYSSGLRVSEVISLKKEHIDFARKTLLINRSKGRRDRFTLLADRAVAFLHEYLKTYAINTWLFPGQAHGHLHVRSAQNIFEKAILKANIHKKVSIHSLRHTFATHLLEGGTDIKYIQALLGHANLKTTERYIHIAKRNILRIRSPFDCDPDNDA